MTPYYADSLVTAGMTCGQRISTPYGMGLIVGFRGNEFVIVALDSGRYVECSVREVW